MKNIPTFEQFINESSSDYTLTDYYNNAKEYDEEGLMKLAMDAAHMIGTTPAKIDVFSSEDGDDNYDKAEERFNKAGDGKAFNNESGTSSWYSKRANIVKLQDESSIAYLVQAGKL
jgi:hypothetical protein